MRPDYLDLYRLITEYQPHHREETTMSETITRLAVRKTNTASGNSTILEPDQDGDIFVAGRYVRYDNREAIEAAIRNTWGASAPLYHYELLVGTLEPVVVKPPVEPLPTEPGVYQVDTRQGPGNFLFTLGTHGWVRLAPWRAGREHYYGPSVASFSAEDVREHVISDRGTRLVALTPAN